MTAPRAFRAFAAAVALAGAAPGLAECRISVEKRRFEGAERTIIRMENERIAVEVVPELEGRLSAYRDKSRPSCAFEWLDDCPYHYGGRWEGKPFTWRLDDKGPKRAAVTVEGGGKVAVRLLRELLGVSLTHPLELAVRRTMSIDADTTRLRIDVQVTNVGQGVAPQFRYMVHGVFGQVPPLPGGGRAYWFLPTERGVEFFDDARGRQEMNAAAGGAPLNHPFSRFLKGRQADKPRYVPGGWGAVLTSAGPTYLCYDPAQYDFMQYWFGGDSAWHYTFEPHTRPVDLRPGQTVSFGFTLACDGGDVPFTTPTVSYRRPDAPTELTPGATFPIEVRGTTVRAEPEDASVSVKLTGPKGEPVLSRDLAGRVKPFEFTPFRVECAIPADAPLGTYRWVAQAGGRALGEGRIDVVSPERLRELQIERLTAAVRTKYEAEIKKLREQADRARKRERTWQEGANLAWGMDDERTWPDRRPPAEATLSFRRNAVAVLGLWKAGEAPRIRALAAVAPPPWPAEADKLLAALGAERTDVRSVAAGPGGDELVALLVNPGRKRVQVVRLAKGRIVRRFGSFSDKPGEADDRLGGAARALAVDPEGNVWVATNAWGKTSVFRVNQDGAPYEESVLGAKGAAKKFSPEGRLLAAVPLLAEPMDLCCASADGAPVLLASYRSVSSYHGAQVREGTMVLAVREGRRIAEIKAPAGSACVDAQGRAWLADVAGHAAAHAASGRKLFDAPDGPPPAVADAQLPAGSPLPVVLRADG
ncbi:MAG TPA: hypothetical protein VM695_00275, partial [Phycisphaerae bacterium]|nr:hypothetical protein [Phycisphaerae bacterium]